MKKFTILILASLLFAAVFAEPKVPKYYSGDSKYKEHEYTYISNDLKYCYEIQATKIDTSKFHYQLNFSKRSLEFDTEMSLYVLFETEKQLDNFIKDIHLSDLENEFNRIRKIIIMIDEKPNPTKLNFEDEYFDFKNRPKHIFYEADGTKF